MILITHFHKCKLPTKALVQFCQSLTHVLQTADVSIMKNFQS